MKELEPVSQAVAQVCQVLAGAALCGSKERESQHSKLWQTLTAFWLTFQKDRQGLSTASVLFLLYVQKETFHSMESCNILFDIHAVICYDLQIKENIILQLTQPQRSAVMQYKSTFSLISLSLSTYFRLQMKNRSNIWSFWSIWIFTCP